MLSAPATSNAAGNGRTAGSFPAEHSTAPWRHRGFSLTPGGLLAASSRSAREAKRRVQQMEAKRELRKEQDKRRKRDNVLAIGAGT